MRILFVTLFYPPDRIGGTETYTHGIARALAQNGHEVRVLCADRWDRGDTYWQEPTDQVYEGIPVRRLQLNWTLAPEANRYLYNNPRIADYCARFLSQWTPDIVHITSCVTLSASVIDAAGRLNLPVVLTLTDFWFLCPRINLVRSDGSLCRGNTTPAECLHCLLAESRWYQLARRVVPGQLLDLSLERATQTPTLANTRGLRGLALDMTERKALLQEYLRRADRVIAPSHFLKAVFVRNGATNPICVLPYGHDLSWLDSYNGKTRSSAIRFGYIGQIVPIKGVHVLVEAFRKLDPGSNAHLSIFGEPDKAPAYAQQLRTLAGSAANISFRGGFAHNQLGKVLAEIDVLVVPSVWSENNPLVIQEAFAAKTPVIATNLGGMSEFVQAEVNGMLFEAGDSAGLACQLERILGEPTLLSKLRQGIRPVKTIDEELTELLAVYREVAAGSPGTTGEFAYAK